MRVIAPIAVLAVLVLAAACSPSDERRTSAELKDAGHSVDAAAQGVAHSAAVRHAEADFRRAGHDAAEETRRLAAQAKVETHKLAAHARGGVHDVTHDSRHDDHSS